MLAQLSHAYALEFGRGLENSLRHYVSVAGARAQTTDGWLYLYRLCRFITARMIYHLHLQDRVLSHLYLLNGANLGRAASDAENQLRGAVFPADPQGEMFFDVLHLSC
jgi:hypothetical protein